MADATEHKQDDWPARYDAARAAGARRAPALRAAVGVDDCGEPVRVQFVAAHTPLVCAWLAVGAAAVAAGLAAGAAWVALCDASGYTEENWRRTCPGDIAGIEAMLRRPLCKRCEKKAQVQS